MTQLRYPQLSGWSIRGGSLPLSETGLGVPFLSVVSVQTDVDAVKWCFENRARSDFISGKNPRERARGFTGTALHHHTEG